MADTTTNFSNSADGRAVGAFQLSIATSLAIEAAVGIHPDLPKPSYPPIKDYKTLWVNLRTLFRNIMGALPKGIADTITPSEIAQIMHEEMQVIPDMLSEYKGQPVKVEYYFNTMKNVETDYPQASIRMDSTPKQKIYTQMLKDVMTIFNRDVKDTFVVHTGKMPTVTEKTLIITNIPHDLLMVGTPNLMHLLESHTGKIKPRALWYSKYYKGRELSHIPFTKELIQVFGDNETFHPMDSRLKSAIMELAEHRKWSSVTTRDRIVAGISELKNPAHVLKMKQIYGIYLT